ncbi:hypothetical protein EJ08DRAFT_182688 [Tothia fuscella]|uniref:DUF8021 domain-containing protein n=1 Tax=Tothia fuscella TaxID=1048955 RepID=A0A9P4TZF6_9PEZI|nr:hypothetical protein EJ08DRAFT_182688 [Tothia fuscella]
MPLLSILFASLASAACTRETLSSTFDTFLNSSISKANFSTTLGLSPTLRISQNNILLKTLPETIYTNTTSLYKPFRIQVIDHEVCEIATFVLLNQNTEPALASIRIKTREDGKTIQELEILNVLKGSHAFFAPQTFPQTAPPMWSTPTTGEGNLTRTQLIQIANLYPSGIQAGDGSAIPGAPTCPRIENGVLTSTTCYKNLANFKQPVTNRRWIADTVTGVVLGGFYFDKPAAKGSKFGLWLNEYFKIEGGRLAGVEAAMKELWGVPWVDVWGPEGRGVSV